MLQTAAIFSEGMILQREKPVVIWGSAAAGEEVTVGIQGQSAKAVTDAQGRWEVVLAPLTASDNETLVAKTAGEELCIGDVAVGEVATGLKLHLQANRRAE